jgi:tRNA threonylcarbamoyladenosine biosynthesis protein TsaB
MPMLESMVEKAGLTLSELNFIAIACGPGSFTGLRIGSATAKGLAHALKLDIVEVPTLYALATNVLPFSGYIIPMMDARRQQVYTAVYVSDGEKLRLVIEEQACKIEDLTNQIKALDHQLPCLLLGDGIKPNDLLIKEKFSDLDFAYAPMHLTIQKASSVGYAAIKMISDKETVSFYEHAPKYLRMSQAEREYKEKIGGNI